MELRTREQWGASYDVTKRQKMTVPAPDLWIHHSVTVPSSDPDADMRAIEQIDINRFGVPSYSYVIHPSGVVLEGMGVHVGAHTLKHNSTSFGVCFIGNFENDEPTDAALFACRELVAYLHDNGVLQPGAQPTGGHKDTGFATACPGAHLYARIPELRIPPETDMPLDTTDKQFIENTMKAMEERLSTRIKDSEVRQNNVIGAVVKASVEAAGDGTLDAQAVADKVLAGIADKLSK